MRTNIPQLLLLSLYCVFLVPWAGAQDSSIKYIMPYECSRLFPEQITEYQAYYNNEVGINKIALQDVELEIQNLLAEKQTRKVKKALFVLEHEKKVLDKLKDDLMFYLDVWLEIEEFYDQRQTAEFIEAYNPAECYTLYTLYDTLQIEKDKMVLREKETSEWMEYPEATDAEYIEDVNVLVPASTRWEKKKADRNCQSADPEDCLVWCLVEIPAEVEVLSRTLNIIECPVSYEKSEDGNRCEKKVKFSGDLEFREREMAIYIEDLKREVEVLGWEECGR